jgi:hypothetical protein
VVEELRELHQDLSTLLNLLLVTEQGLTDDVTDLLALASHQCRQFVPAATAEWTLKVRVLALIHGEHRDHGTQPRVRPLLPPPARIRSLLPPPARPQRASALVPAAAQR